jgi:hypothetical protein
MPQVEFEPTIPVFDRAKAVHASDRAATVIGRADQLVSNNEERGLLIRILLKMVLFPSYISIYCECLVTCFSPHTILHVMKPSKHIIDACVGSPEIDF